MFERFTERARRVLVLAQEEARFLEHNFIGTEHLLLGLVREADGVAAKALGELGIGLDDVRQRVKETIGPAGSPMTSSPPFTPRAKKVLELSLREALQLQHNYIGTEHILLGLVREGEGVAARVLVSLGADLSRVRQKVVDLLGTDPAAGLFEDPNDLRRSASPPRCGRCDASLAESARYRTIEVPPDEDEAGSGQGPVRATLPYCSFCGTVIGPPSEARAISGGPVTTLVYGTTPPTALPERSQRFPDELLGAVHLEDVPEDARVELVYRDDEVLEGTAAGTRVYLRGRVRSRRGPLKGTWGEVAFGAAWRLGDRLHVLRGPLPAHLSGRFGEDAVKLKATAHLGPQHLFERAEVGGELCGHAVRAEVNAASGGLGSTSTLVAEGTVGDSAFQLFGALSADLSRTIVRGSVGGAPVSLDATRPDPFAPVRVIGAFSGPPALLALLVGAVVSVL
jgi:hypothetical protein